MQSARSPVSSSKHSAPYNLTLILVHSSSLILTRNDTSNSSMRLNIEELSLLLIFNIPSSSLLLSCSSFCSMTCLQNCNNAVQLSLDFKALPITTLKERFSSLLSTSPSLLFLLHIPLKYVAHYLLGRCRTCTHPEFCQSYAENRKNIHVRYYLRHSISEASMFPLYPRV